MIALYLLKNNKLSRLKKNKTATSLHLYNESFKVLNSRLLNTLEIFILKIIHQKKKKKFAKIFVK